MIHMFKDKTLLRRVRKSLSEDPNRDLPLETNPRKFDKNPMLGALYAETLRLYAKSYVTASSPYSDVKLGRWWLPKGEQLLINSHISQMDSSFWNTKDGAHPVETFWADRFLYDPKNPSSGPVQPSARHEVRLPEKKSDTEPYFSLDGLDAAWIPYGGACDKSHIAFAPRLILILGGHKKCPGRFLAKTIINLICATLSENFDIELLTDDLSTSPWKFGMGILRPKSELPFRIRRRIPEKA
jgi:cytochrome P450